MNLVLENWDEIIQRLKIEHGLSDVSFKTWIAPLEVYKVEDSVVYILVPLKGGIDYIEKKYTQKAYTKKKRSLLYLKIGQRVLQLGIKKNKFEHVDIKTKEKQLQLGENFYLPFFIGRKNIYEFELENLEYTKE